MREVRVSGVLSMEHDALCGHWSMGSNQKHNKLWYARRSHGITCVKRLYELLSDTQKRSWASVIGEIIHSTDETNTSMNTNISNVEVSKPVINSRYLTDLEHVQSSKCNLYNEVTSQLPQEGDKCITHDICDSSSDGLILLPSLSWWVGGFEAANVNSTSNENTCVQEEFLLYIKSPPPATPTRFPVVGVGYNCVGRFELIGSYLSSTGEVELTKHYKIAKKTEKARNRATSMTSIGTQQRRKSARRRVNSTVLGDEYVNPNTLKKRSRSEYDESYSDSTHTEENTPRGFNAYGETLPFRVKAETRSGTLYSDPSRRFDTVRRGPGRPANVYSNRRGNYRSTIPDKTSHGHSSQTESVAVSLSLNTSGSNTRDGTTKWVECCRLSENAGALAGELYEGTLVNGKPHGNGTVVYHTGWMYEGDFQDGRETGWGVVTDERDVVIYEGELICGEVNGYGTVYFENNDKYIGSWRDGLFHGQGSFLSHTGASYEGSWCDGRRHGLGTAYYVDESCYMGTWNNGRRDGKGDYTTVDGFKYSGTWVDDIMDGKGTAVYPNGSVYEGTFKRGLRDGRGTLRFANGATYTGRWKDDQMDGTGTVDMPRTAQIDEDSFIIPVHLNYDLKRIHARAGFDHRGH